MIVTEVRRSLKADTNQLYRTVPDWLKRKCLLLWNTAQRLARSYSCIFIRGHVCILIPSLAAIGLPQNNNMHYYLPSKIATQATGHVEITLHSRRF